MPYSFSKNMTIMQSKIRRDTLMHGLIESVNLNISIRPSIIFIYFHLSD